jgi:hypothetical protein
MARRKLALLPTLVGGIKIAVLIDGPDNYASNRVGDIVVVPGPMIDAITTATRSSPLERAQLIH